MGLAQGSREVESETKEMRQGAGTGGNAAREGGRDACGGRGARCALYGCAAMGSARLTSCQTVTRRTLRITREWTYICPSRPLTRSISVMHLPELSALRSVGSSARSSHSQRKMRPTYTCGVCRRKGQGETIGPFVLGRQGESL